MKKILGLDLGTNSIGWALVEIDDFNNPSKIIGLGSRIIPMGAELSKFEQGQAQTKNANRRIKRGARKLNKRYKQRRNKLIYVLQKLGILPSQIQLTEDFKDPNKIDKISIKPISKNQPQLTALDLIDIRVRALREAIPLEDLGRLFYKYNQLRGYSGGSGEPEKEDSQEENDESETIKKRESIITLAKITELGETEEIVIKGKNLKKRKIKLEVDHEDLDSVVVGDTYLETLKLGDSLELQINITRAKKGETITIKLPNKTSWRKKMESLETELIKKTKERGSKVFLSEHFHDLLKENKWLKIRDNVVLRSRYEEEFKQIWDTQYHKNEDFKKLVDNKQLLNELVNFIFPERPNKSTETDKSLVWKNNSQKQIFREKALSEGLYWLLKEQIIYYQRELKDQSHLISFCRFEPEERVVAKSHPVFQEYKIWEQINKLTINTKTENGKNKKGEIKYSYHDRPVPIELKEYLFEELQNRKEIGFATVYKELTKKYGLRENVDFLNGLEKKSKLKGNETKLLFQKSLGPFWEAIGLNDMDKQIQLWDILYNGKGNEYDLKSDRTSKVLNFLKTSGGEIENTEQVAIEISKIKFSRNYSNLSLKAIEKIMPLVRAGKYFNSEFTIELNEKIERLYNENLTDPFEKSAQEFLHRNTDYLAKGGILNAYATMMVYNRHTEKEYSKEELLTDYKQIKRLEHGELRNPLAEQIISETLVLVQDIWKQYDTKPSEIRLELARELKNSATERQKIHSNNQKNQKENTKIKERLIEYKVEITNANIEKLKLWLSQKNLQDEYVKNYKDPSKSEIEKLKLWEEQGHISPYTGKPIPLASLFNKGQYDIDHIIPKSRYFDDSFTNKVICETSVNKDKGNRTAMEYFEVGSITQDIRKKEHFIDEVNKMFFGKKRQNLLATRVPEDPITRQIKDTQYIATRTKEELCKIVGNGNVKTTTGGVTDYLRNQWGLTDKFKKILKPRYENILVNETFINSEYGLYKKNLEKRIKEYEEANQVFNEIVLDKERFLDSFKANYIQYKHNKLVIKGWSKRIDHRHHAIDALVVACTKQEHIQRLNNLNKELQDWLEKRRKEVLPDFEGNNSELLDEIMNLEKDKREKIILQIEKFSKIDRPWASFPDDVERELNSIIVSHKPKDKLLIQQSIDGNYQIKLRGQLHQETIYGKTQVKECYKIPLSKLAGRTFATEKTIEKITNEFIKEKIQKHLYNDFKGNKEEAFSAEGILDLNKKLALKKNRRGELAPHAPISKIKIFYKDPTKNIKAASEDINETDALQRLDRQKSFNSSQFVLTGDNYLFAVLEKEEEIKKTNELKKKRVYDLITFFNASNYLKYEFNNAPDKANFNKDLCFKEYFERENNARLLFTLKQNDFVYLPDENEEVVLDETDPNFKRYWCDKASRSNNIYLVQKFSKKQIYFIKHTVAAPIANKIEFGSQNCFEKVGERSIKEHCIKLQINRLGDIYPKK
uniref:type II CRISPR RNA-guided endonuclease Cas9 n=1 Tax=Roseivirga sp. TaxID=1964215 RepID=UPI00404709B7